jgi:hypothetical protein
MIVYLKGLEHNRSWPILRYYPCSHMEGVTKLTQNLNQHNERCGPAVILMQVMRVATSASLFFMMISNGVPCY